MNLRNYNIYFNTHTISGIIICALLYVIFFAGSFSFFKKEITAWQNNTSYHQQEVNTANYTYLLDSISRGGYNLQGRDIIFYLQQGGLKGYVNFSASQDTIVHKANMAAMESAADGSRRGRGRRGGGDTKYFSHDFVRMESGDYASNYDMGEFLYRLHFLAQLNEVPIRLGFAPFGYMVAGITSFLFLFALITGLLLHWDKIVSNFFVFRPFSKWKTVWTDMHTALGVIGFPYQFIFAVTGIILIINTVLVVPFGTMLYDGDKNKVYEELEQTPDYQLAYSYQPLQGGFELGNYLDMAAQRWPGSALKRVNIMNYGDQNMYVVIQSEAGYDKSFAGKGILAVAVKDGRILGEKSPFTDVSYVDQVRSLIYRLHFGDFGGYPVKTIYFVLGVMGCLVIISGILIWLVARDKNNVIPRKRKFNFWVANVFLAICLTMLPVTAITFIAIKVNPDVNQQFIYRVFFHLWWILSLYYIIRRNLNRTNRETLLLGGIFSLLVPIANGLVTGNWLWVTAMDGSWDLFVVDFVWLVLGVISFLVLGRLKEFNERPKEMPKPAIRKSRVATA
ncbi:PepSY domain-containing protein [Sphingobacterium sp. JB170]|uniref:PepSY-associated TM helix domain-containing protein n=1 Tax=Sphingobacterium sp. JB170 TaxID=1434842 RepID=UPI00097F2AF4|nr:PepSY-associated TM helix domain-containing protein [Sphingobacterium sp. JB170]SJN19866.1 putative iron-regulated membrane protein [Sphingobacterium sp. JB170]